MKTRAEITEYDAMTSGELATLTNGEVWAIEKAREAYARIDALSDADATNYGIGESEIARQVRLDRTINGPLPLSDTATTRALHHVTWCCIAIAAIAALFLIVAQFPYVLAGVCK